MKAVCTPETLLDVYQIAWCHIPEDCTLCIHCMRTLHLGNSKIVCKNWLEGTSDLICQFLRNLKWLSDDFEGISWWDKWVLWQQTGQETRLIGEASLSAHDDVSFLYDKFLERKLLWQLCYNVKCELAEFYWKERGKHLLEIAFILFLGV
jgi:hypothetical protein